MSGPRDDGFVAAVENEPVVDLVAHHQEVTLLCQVCHSVQSFAGDDRPRGVVGGVEEEHLASVRDDGFDGFRPHHESFLEQRRHVHDTPAGPLDVRPVGRKMRFGHEHFIAGVEDGPEVVGEGPHAAQGDHDVCFSDAEAVLSIDGCRQGLEQFPIALGRRIVRGPAQGIPQGFVTNPAFSMEIRLSDAERDDVIQCVRSQGHLPDNRCADVVDDAGNSMSHIPPMTRRVKIYALFTPLWQRLSAAISATQSRYCRRFQLNCHSGTAPTSAEHETWTARCHSSLIILSSKCGY